MALRDQPYFPLYVQDYLTDEKLNECSASTQGIYIKIMCLMHKSENYGKILLKQKYKQSENICLNYAGQFANHLPFDKDDIYNAIVELINEKVCYLDGDFLCQKRMIKDNDLSIIRASAGKKGGKSTQKNKVNFAKAKSVANSEYEYESENEYENKDESENEKNLKLEFEKSRKIYPGTKRGLDTEWTYFKKCHKDYKQILPILEGSILYQIEAKSKMNGFVPEWSHFRTYIYNRKWEEEFSQNPSKSNNFSNLNRIIDEKYRQTKH